MIIPPVHVETMKEMEDYFHQFIRNGFWGTCECCPREEVEGKVTTYPEKCINSTRDDHLKDPEDLFEYHRTVSNKAFRRLVDK